MHLPDKAIQEYVEIYEREFGEKITVEEARVQGERLLDLFKVIYRPIPNETNDKHQL